MKANWPRKQLGEIIELHYGKGISKHDRYPEGKYPVYGANGALGRTNKFLVNDKAVIIGRKGSAGELTRVSGRFWPSDVTYYVLGNDKVDIDYIFYLFKSLNLPKLAVGVKPGINRNRIYEIEIPIPPIGEQKRIVEKLEKMLGKIKEAKKLREESLEATQNLLPAELHKIFGDGRKNGWEEKEIKDICEHPQYGFTESSSREKIGPKFLRITDIQDGKVDWETVPYCRCKEIQKYKLSEGDIVFARTGATVGKSYLINKVPVESIFASYLIRLRALGMVLPEFLYYFFQSPNYWQQITDEQVGMAQPNVNGSRLAKIKIPLPLLAEQRKIVAHLDSLSEKIEELKKLQLQTATDLDALEKSILHQAFEGNL